MDDDHVESQDIVIVNYEQGDELACEIGNENHFVNREARTSSIRRRNIIPIFHRSGQLGNSKNSITHILFLNVFR